MRGAILVGALVIGGCGSERAERADRRAPSPSATPDPIGDRWQAARDAMVDDTIVGRGVRDERVIAAMRAVPRHLMVPAHHRDRAYGDHPLPIGHDQTISQPYIVAAMTEAAAVAPGERVLEVGTGSGYQAAVLAEIGADVYSIEIVEPLGRATATLLGELGYDKIKLRIGDGYRGWPEAAPFDAIIVTAAPPAVPQPLIDQLAIGGRLVIPVGEDRQRLDVITRVDRDKTSTESLFPVRFVPMTGEAQR
jgi:protein-L-isoaspartate(D-aspartate) O-methyltransferase